MAERKIERMTVEEFLAWQPEDEQRYELVDGLPVAMTGARRRHDDIVVETLFALRSRLTGTPCRPQTDDLAVRTGQATIRRPDVTVDCGPRGGDDLVATGPVLIVEVLSPSTRMLDKHLKAIEYKRLESVRQILILDSETHAAILHDRVEQGGWSEQAKIGKDAMVDLWSLSIRMPLGEFYPPESTLSV